MKDRRLWSISPVIRRALYLKTDRMLIPFRVNFDYLVAYVAEGVLELQMDASETRCLLHQGDVLFLHPGIEHGLRSIGSEPLHLPHIHFDLYPQKDSNEVPVNFKSRKECNEKELRMIRKDMFPEIPFVLHLDNHLEVKRCILDVIDCYGASEEVRVLRQKALTLNLLYLLVQGSTVRNPYVTSVDKYRSELEEAAEYMDHHSCEQIGNEDLARMSHLSLSYYNKLFRAHFGVSPTQYHIQCRMVRARNLLDETRLNLEDIADQTGYESVHSFCKAFKKYTGITPGRFRNECIPTRGYRNLRKSG
jgi:AraC-like DNA-binding protein